MLVQHQAQIAFGGGDSAAYCNEFAKAIPDPDSEQGNSSSNRGASGLCRPGQSVVVQVVRVI